MNKEEIDKWLDEKYGCSYTILEELHDFYFEKYTDLKEENKQLKENNMSMQEEMARTWKKADLYKEVIEKVREYVKEYKFATVGFYIHSDNLLQILDKGVDK